jgi:hypothetical protein
MENTPSERWQAAKRLQYSLSVTVPAFAANLPHGRREIGSHIVDRQNNASLNQRFERLQLALKRLARSNRRAITPQALEHGNRADGEAPTPSRRALERDDAPATRERKGYPALRERVCVTGYPGCVDDLNVV